MSLGTLPSYHAAESALPSPEMRRPRGKGKLREFLWSFAALSVVSMLVGGGSAAGSLGQQLPHDRLIVLGRSIAGIHIGESRASVEKAFGRGRSTRRGFVWYFGSRLLVDYWVHDRLQTWVGGLETTWPGFHTRLGVRVGSSRRERPLHVSYSTDGECSLPARPALPDAPRTSFTLQHGKIAKIDVSYG